MELLLASLGICSLQAAQSHPPRRGGGGGLLQPQVSAPDL